MLKSDNFKSRSKKRRSSSSSSSEEWVEKKIKTDREDWMSVPRAIKTFSKDDIKPKAKPQEKKHIDSYNPGTSVRELNPYWKNGGKGLPQTSEEIIKSRKFIKPKSGSDYYSSSRKEFPKGDDRYKHSTHRDSRREDYYSAKSHTKSNNWKKGNEDDKRRSNRDEENYSKHREKRDKAPSPTYSKTSESTFSKSNRKESNRSEDKETKYLSDEKMNKLAAKIVKAEIMGDKKVVEDLKAKLEKARQYRKENPGAGPSEDHGVMLTTMDKMGNVRPLSKPSPGDAKSKTGKRKVKTHETGERLKYFSNDDRYNLSQMFEQEKYGNGHEDEAEFAKIVSKHKNPNDDLEDVFTDEISKHKNDAKDSSKEKQKAIKQHQKMEKSLDGCAYCIGSKNMLKHLMVACGEKTYVALPAQKSLVQGHCIITSIHHTSCVTAADEDVWEEILEYRKVLTSYFSTQDQDVVFFETASRLNKYPHMVINCVPLPRDVGDMAAIYFKKALLECETEWAVNKKVVELKGKNIRKAVPKGLPYFWVDFGIDPGFAHIIEDQHEFPSAFAQEIIGGMLDLDHSLWKRPHKENSEQQCKKVLEFMQTWKDFDTVSRKKIY